MKKSELKEYIKEAIIAELTEENMDEGTYVGAGAVGAMQKDPKFAAAKDKTAALNTLKSGGSVTLEAKKAKDEDDTEDDEEKLDKKAQAAAKKGGGKVGKLQRVTAQLKELEKEMKELVGKWKKAEGKEKETLLDKLKEKTKVKKELEALEDKLADAIV
jgi:NADH dehydrogenase/NADH:ubiquinone oxidoreductase subunit G